MLNELIKREEYMIKIWQDAKIDYYHLEQEQEESKNKLIVNESELNKLAVNDFRPRNFNPLQKLFSFKYKKYIKDEQKYKRQLEQKETIENNAKHLFAKIQLNDAKMQELENILEEFTDERVMEFLQLDSDIEKLEYFLKYYPELRKDTNSLKEAISVSEHLIIYDETYDKDLYVSILEEALKMHDASFDHEHNINTKEYEEQIHKIIDLISGPLNDEIKSIMECLKQDIATGFIDGKMWVSSIYFDNTLNFLENRNNEIQEKGVDIKI